VRFGPSPTRCALSWVRAPRPRYFTDTVSTFPQLTTGKPPPRKKQPASSPLEGPSRGRLRRSPLIERRACAACRHLKAALLAESGDARVACGPDGPQLARRSRDQLRRRMGQHGAALGRGRGGGCEVFRAPPSLGRHGQLEERQRAGPTQSRVREHGGRRTTRHGLMSR
jgi:hypothetical protein